MNYISLGKRIYDCRRWINYRFLVVFWLRCIFHPHEVQHLHDFLQADRLRQRIFAVNPQFFGQLTRCFFFRNATWQERLALIETTMEEMEGFFSKASLERLYLDENNPLVVMELPAIRADAMEPVQLDMLFRAGEVREGAMSLRIRQGDRIIYHVNFWLQHNKDGKAMYLGCHQGSKDGLTVNKAMTKAYFGYRPKNLIIFFVRLLAKELQCQSLYAVSNYGFYAQNHFGRRNRKLLVSYDAFWQECGGTLCEDKRFYDLPLEESQKQMTEVPTRKRAVYSKRFALLSELRQDFLSALQQLKR